MSDVKTIRILPPLKGDYHYNERKVITTDGDVEIRTEESGRFSLMRRIDGFGGYQLIGNYPADWGIEIREEVAYL